MSSPPLRSARTPGAPTRARSDRLRDWLAGRPLDDATLAEYLADRFEAGHSPAAAGASIVEMQTAGRWQSPSMPDGVDAPLHRAPTCAG